MAFMTGVGRYRGAVSVVNSMAAAGTGILGLGPIEGRPSEARTSGHFARISARKIVSILQLKGNGYTKHATRVMPGTG